MILTDREIAIALDSTQLIIEPRPAPEVFSSSSVDLTLADSGLVWDIKPPMLVELREGYKISSIAQHQKPVTINPYRLEPNKFILAWTRERIKLSVRSRLAARVEGKSSLARLGIGVHINAPTIHAGFPSETLPPQPIQLEMFNYSEMTFNLYPGLRICQLIIEQTFGTPDSGYEGQFSQQGPAPGN
jgi:dCTP deaminase